jgi:hypothetical protein
MNVNWFELEGINDPENALWKLHLAYLLVTFLPLVS